MKDGTGLFKMAVLSCAPTKGTRMDIYLINLDTETARLARMTERLRGVPFIRVAAHDGRGKSGNGILSGPEIGCAMSHMEAWARLLSSAASYACVLEDDAVLSPDFSAMLDDDRWLPADFDFIKIETTLGRVRLTGKSLPADKRELRRLNSMHVNTTGYIVSRAGARKAFEIAKSLSAQIDQMIFNGAGLSMKTYQIVPALCIQEWILNGGDNSESSIRPEGYRSPKIKRTTTQKIVREISRLASLPSKLMFAGNRIPFV